MKRGSRYLICWAPLVSILCLLGQAALQQKYASIGASSASEEVRYEVRWDTQNSGVTTDLSSVHFISPSEGWAAGKANTIIKTSDGGKNWKRLLESQDRPDFEEVRFINSNQGWARSSNILLHTADGGESWQPARALPSGDGFGGGCLQGPVRFQMCTHNLGAGVFHTGDGQSWEKLGRAPARNDYTTLFVFDPQHAWVAGDYGIFALTQDGGTTWKDIKLQSADLIKIQFISPTKGWLLARRGHNGGPLTSSDGGNTWGDQYAGIPTSQFQYDIEFLNEKDGFLLSEHIMHRTSDGGKVWKTIGKFQADPLGLSFPKLDEGWVVGKKGFISHYHLVPVAPKK